ncbi:hypothetical protein UB46_23830 [Burkholderiaceae bacterium 16]|nr:hypothetical protein UB46_23830 [Burkholderiaceae bacterium 16]
MEWFDHLAEVGSFEGKSSVLELGPQDFFFSGEDITSVSNRRLKGHMVGETVSLICNTSVPFREKQAAFYSLFGLNDYKSTDQYDKRADFDFDLNLCTESPEKYDVIVDSGTNEHVFNASNVFVFTHNSLKPGGIALKILPTYGDNTHGFFNIHPTVYFDVARVNGYKILDFRYIDDMSGRTKERGIESLISRGDFERGLTSFAGSADLQSRISENFSKNLERAILNGGHRQAHFCVDYCCVAMQKMTDEPFRYPGQGVYLTEFGDS